MTGIPPWLPSRRQFLGWSGAAAGGAVVLGGVPSRAVAAAADRPALAVRASGVPADPWAMADRIVAETVRPRFPDRHFDITDYGAVGDGEHDCSQAFAAAIAGCATRGGGHVVVPPGRFLTGAIHLLSRVDLHVMAGGTIAFRTDQDAYLPVVYTRDGGIECMNYSPFVYAYGQHDIAVTGEGTLDGQASDQYWWPWTGNSSYGWVPGDPTGAADATLLAQMAADGVPVSQRVFGAGHYLRPQFIQPYRCQNVLISGITTTNTPNWQMNPVLCTNVTVENVTASSLGPNNDGCDPECCDYVVITGCTFNAGDDCIAVKAGKDADGRRVNVPCQNIVIQNCEFLAGHGMVTIGSEMTGGVRYLFARDSRVDSLTLSDGLRLKTNSQRGGFIEYVYVKNIKAETLTDAGVSVNFYYGSGPGYGYNPVVHDIHVDRLWVGTTVYPVYLVGYSDDPVETVTLRDCIFDTATRSSVAQHVGDLTFSDVYVNNIQATPPQPYATLAAAYNNAGAGTASVPGNLDGHGRYYTSDSLASAGLSPGAAVMFAGHTFTWPDVAAGSDDNVACADEVALLSGSGSALGFLGCGTNGSQSGTLYVSYSDGTSASATLAFTDWWDDAASSGDQLVSSAKSSGGRTVGVYYQSIALNSAKTVQSVELPSNANLHIFAAAIV